MIKRTTTPIKRMGTDGIALLLLTLTPFPPELCEGIAKEVTSTSTITIVKSVT